MSDAPSPKRRVLLIDDEADLRRLLSYSLEAAGYDVRAAATGEEGLREVAAFEPDLVLLDLMLHDVSGFEVCRRIRGSAVRRQPIVVMLTARGEEIDRVVGFEVGADDYVVKPFSVRELMLRMDARLKAGAGGPSTATPNGASGATGPAATPHMVLGPLEIDPAGHHVYVNGVEVHVSALEMRLLLFLFEAPGHVRSRRQLLTEVWGYQPDVTSRTVDTHVKRLRDKLGVAGALIQTVRGLGYRLADLSSAPPLRKRTGAHDLD